MKQARRKELQTNELSVYLHQIRDAVQRHANYLLGGLVVVVLILVVALYVRQSRHAAIETARNQYDQIRQGDVVAEPQLLEEVRQLAAQYGDHSELGPAVLQAAGDAAYEMAESLTAPEDQDRRRELLEEARTRYEQKVRLFGNRPLAAAEAHMSLAALEETLVTTGQGSRERIETYYQQVIDAPPNPFQRRARERLQDLDERLAPLEIVATRPADEPAPAAAAPQIQFEPVPLPAEPEVAEEAIQEPAPEEPAPADAPAPQEPAPAEEPAPQEPAPAEEPVQEEPAPAEEPAPEQQDSPAVDSPAVEPAAPSQEPAAGEPSPEEPVEELPAEEPVAIEDPSSG